MGKGNSGILSKFQSKLEYSASGVIGDSDGYEVLTEVVLRLRTTGARSGHTLQIQARMEIDPTWEDIGVLEGSTTDIFHIASWDRVRFINLTFDATSPVLYASGFFQDGMFTVQAINSMDLNIKDRLEEINSNVCDLKKEIKIINRQIELITDHEEDELK